MNLTKEELNMLDGKYGYPVQKAMELLVALGDCYDAPEMVLVSSAHLSAANPINAGEGGIHFIKNIVQAVSKLIIKKVKV